MCFYKFHVDGFGMTAAEFHPDARAAERAAFETALEVSRSLGELVFVTVTDSEGSLICRAPQVPREIQANAR
jgi:hypothetical protein